MPHEVASVLTAGQPSYFFVTSNTDGSVKSVRELDTEDQAAKSILPALKTVKLPVVQVDASPVPISYIVRLTRDSEGNLIVTRSVAEEAVAIASALMPGEFPLPDSANPSSETPSTPSDGGYRVGNGVSAPRILNKVEPQYTPEAIKARLIGDVGLRVVVDTDGKARDIQLVRALGLGLDENAIAAVSNWQFQPGIKESQPVKVLAQIQVHFALQNKDPKQARWHMARAQFSTPDAALRPVVDKIVSPHVIDDPTSATATLKFNIDEKGAPINVQIEKSSERRMGPRRGQCARQMEVHLRLQRWRANYSLLHDGFRSRRLSSTLAPSRLTGSRRMGTRNVLASGHFAKTSPQFRQSHVSPNTKIPLMRPLPPLQSHSAHPYAQPHHIYSSKQGGCAV